MPALNTQWDRQGTCLPRGTETLSGESPETTQLPMAESVLDLRPQDSLSSALLKIGLSRGSAAGGEEHGLEV